MRHTGRFYVLGVILAVLLLAPQHTYAYTGVCKYFNVVLTPFGLCSPPEVVLIEVPTATTTVVYQDIVPTPMVQETVETVIIEDSTWQQYAAGVNRLLANVINYLSTTNQAPSPQEGDFITRELFDLQVEALGDSAGGSGNVSAGSDVTFATLTVSGDATLETLTSGTATFNGALTFTDLGGGLLQTDANGVVSTTTLGAASVTDDSLDFDKFVDSFTLDATATFDLDTNNADLNFDNNTLFIDADTNNVGIGTSSIDSSRLRIEEVYQGTVGYQLVNNHLVVDVTSNVN